MSAIGELALSSSPSSAAERRATPRLRVGTHPVRLGRSEGVLIDLSDRGARVRHVAAVRRGETLRIALDWEGELFSAQAEVLFSRVVSLGDGTGTIYESRLRFVSMPGGAADVLRRTLAGIEKRDMRRWVANLRGWEPDTEPTKHPVLVTTTFLRYRMRGVWWEKKATHDHHQPEDGFTLPADVEESEATSLCQTYEKVDADARRVISMIAAQVVGEARAAAARLATMAR